MKRVLLFDTETTGVDVATDQVIEVGCCLFDLELGCPLESYAALLQADGNAAESINKIPAAALPTARPRDVVWSRVVDLARTADAVAAHNAEFDRKFVEAAGVRFESPWVCTLQDFPWEGGGGRSLTAVALSLGLGVATAHRALADVEVMARILIRMKEMGRSLPDLFTHAARPKKRFVAMVSFEMKDVAKNAGFLWDAGRRQWWRMMPPEDALELSFRVAQVD